MADTTTRWGEGCMGRGGETIILTISGRFEMGDKISTLWQYNTNKNPPLNILWSVCCSVINRKRIINYDEKHEEQHLTNEFINDLANSLKIWTVIYRNLNNQFSQTVLYFVKIICLFSSCKKLYNIHFKHIFCVSFLSYPHH